MMTIDQIDAARKTLVQLGAGWALFNAGCFVRLDGSAWIVEEGGKLTRHRRVDGKPQTEQVTAASVAAEVSHV